MTNEVRMTNVQNPGQDGDGVQIPFELRNSSFLRHWVLRHLSFISGCQVQSGAVQLGASEREASATEVDTIPSVAEQDAMPDN